MNLIDQYLKSVARFLPARTRDDIVRELAENIRCHVEDRQAELGRPVTEADVQTILDGLGNPAVVAGRFRGDRYTLAFGRRLVGPELFPFYAKVLAFNVGLTCVVCAVVVVVRLAGGHAMALFPTASAIGLQLLAQFAIVTAIFVVAERSLLAGPEGRRARRPEGADPGRIPRVESFAQLVALAILLAWIPALRHFADSFGPESAGLALAPSWRVVYRAIVWLAAVGLVQAIVNLLRPRWTRFRSAVRAGSDLVWLVVTYLVLTANHEVATSTALTLSGHERQAVQMLNDGLFYGVLGVAVIAVIAMIRDVRHLVRGRTVR
jgi:hypothetical protein